MHIHTYMYIHIQVNSDDDNTAPRGAFSIYICQMLDEQLERAITIMFLYVLFVFIF